MINMNERNVQVTKILITGQNSFIGTSFKKYISQWENDYQVDFISVRGEDWRSKSFNGYDCVLHVAGIAHINTKSLNDATQSTYWYINSQLPDEVAQVAKSAGVKQFVFLSSMSVYGVGGGLSSPVVINSSTPVDPKDIYGKSKLAAENMIKQHASPDFIVSILRPPMVYGPGCKGNYNRLARLARVTPFFPSIKNKRSMIFSINLCAFIKRVIDERLPGIFHPQNAQLVSTENLVNEIARANGNRIILFSCLNPLIRRMHLQIISKVFGDLYYDDSIANICDMVGFTESISITEGTHL